MPTALRSDIVAEEIIYDSGLFEGDDCFKTRDVKARARTTLARYGDLRIGCLVKVDDDLSTGKKEFGGMGFVRVDHGDLCYDIELIGIEKGRKLNKVPLDRITVMPLSAAYPSIGSTELRRRSSRFVTEVHQNNDNQGEEEDEPVRDILDALNEECSGNRKRGWRFFEHYPDATGLPRFKTDEFKACYLAEYLIVTAEAKRLGCILRRNSASKKFKKRKRRFDPVTVKHLNYAWGVGINFGKQVEAKILRMPKRHKKCKDIFHKSVISDPHFAKIYFTPARLYAQYHSLKKRLDAYDAGEVSCWMGTSFIDEKTGFMPWYRGAKLYLIEVYLFHACVQDISSVYCWLRV